MRKINILFVILFAAFQTGKAQCPGNWTGITTALNYLCANGPFIQVLLNSDSCPAAAQSTYHFNTPPASVKLDYSAFGSEGFPGQSRMSVFINGRQIDLHKACIITTGCQTPAGSYSLSSTGCLIDSVSGADGGISGYIIVRAADYDLATIDSLGVAVNEPSASGTIFQIDSCNPGCNGTVINSISEPGGFNFIYPNPASGKTNIYFPDADAHYTVTIFNNLGSVLSRAEVENADHYTVNRSQTGSGMFFCTLEQDGRIVYRGSFIFIE